MEHIRAQPLSDFWFCARQPRLDLANPFCSLDHLLQYLLCSQYLTPQNSTSEQSLDSAWLLSTESVTRKASFKRESVLAGSIFVYPCDACHSTKARISGCSPVPSDCAKFSRRSPNFCGGVSFGLAVFRCNCALGPIGAGSFAGSSCSVSAVVATRAAIVTKKRE